MFEFFRMFFTDAQVFLSTLVTVGVLAIVLYTLYWAFKD